MCDTAGLLSILDKLPIGGSPIGLEPFGPRTGERRRRGVEAGFAGDAATARSLLVDEDASVRATALGALARAGALTAGDVRSGCHDPTPTVRRRAAEILGRMGPESGPTAPLLPLLEDPEAVVVEAAAWAAGERADVAAVDALTRVAAEHEDPRCRESAVAALGAIGDPAGLPAVLAATADRATVRRRAVLALAPFEGPEVEAALHRALGDRDWQVRQAAEDLLEDRG